MKKLGYEILWIVAASIVLGMAYNLSTTQLPLIYEPKEVKASNEFDAVFNTTDTSVAEQVPPVGTSVQANTVQEPVKDTSKTLAPPTGKQTVPETGKEQLVADARGKMNKPKGKQYTEITYEQLKSRLDNPKLYIIDARTPEMFKKGHIPNSVNIDPHNENGQEYLAMLTNIPTDKIIVVYCDGGDCELSHIVIEDLVYLGYKNIFLYYGGWDDWYRKNS